MKKIVVIFIAVVVVTMFLIMGCNQAKISEGAVAVDTNPQQTGLWVSAEGYVYASPDVAILNIGIEADAKTVADAQGQATEAMSAVMVALQQFEIAQKDIQTSQYSIEAIRKWVEDAEDYILTGYRVTNTVTVKVRDLDETGQIIDSAAAAGGEFVRINSIGFSIEDPIIYQEQAREAAVTKAIDKAEQLTDFSGISLGKMIYITESAGYVSPVYKEAVNPSYDSSMTTPISPGQQKISVTVAMIFDIK